MFSVGDRVKIKNHKDRPEAEIVEVKNDSVDLYSSIDYQKKYVVRFVDSEEYSHLNKEYLPYQLEKILSEEDFLDGCQCGLRFSSGGLHQRYCKNYHLNNVFQVKQ